MSRRSRAGVAAAGLGVTSAILHLAALPTMPMMLSVAMAAFALVCMGCVPQLLRGATVRTWVMVGALSAGMLALHVGAMAVLAGPAEAASGHGYAAHPDHPAADDISGPAGHLLEHLLEHLHGRGWDLMHLASLVALAELGLALTMGGRSRRVGAAQVRVADQRAVAASR